MVTASTQLCTNCGFGVSKLPEQVSSPTVFHNTTISGTFVLRVHTVLSISQSFYSQLTDLSSSNSQTRPGRADTDQDDNEHEGSYASNPALFSRAVPIKSDSFKIEMSDGLNLIVALYFSQGSSTLSYSYTAQQQQQQHLNTLISQTNQNKMIKIYNPKIRRGCIMLAESRFEVMTVLPCLSAHFDTAHVSNADPIKRRVLRLKQHLNLPIASDASTHSHAQPTQPTPQSTTAATTTATTTTTHANNVIVIEDD